MSKQEATIQALHTLYARLDTLRQMKVSDMLYPGQQTTFEQTIEEACVPFSCRPTKILFDFSFAGLNVKVDLHE